MEEEGFNFKSLHKSSSYTVVPFPIFVEVMVCNNPWYKLNACVTQKRYQIFIY